MQLFKSLGIALALVISALLVVLVPSFICAWLQLNVGLGAAFVAFGVYVVLIATAAVHFCRTKL